MTKVYHRRGRDDWETPKEIFDALDLEFCFDLDAAADHYNAKCDFYFTENGSYMKSSDGPCRISRDNGLGRDWHPHKTVWVNPPYSEWQKWVAKASVEAEHGVVVVMLLPARTDTKAFHEYIYNKDNVEVRFVKGRIKFVGAEHGAPFPSMIVVFRPPQSKALAYPAKADGVGLSMKPNFSLQDWKEMEEDTIWLDG